jgi:hypothetical protein
VSSSTFTSHDDDLDQVPARRRTIRETKPALKTTELVVYLVSVVGVLVASAVVDNAQDGQGFNAHQAWFLVTLLTIGYLISRGLAKSGSHEG